MPEKIYWGFARLFLRNDISLFFFDFLKDTACPCSFRGLPPKQDRQPSSQKRGICHKKKSAYGTDHQAHTGCTKGRFRVSLFTDAHSRRGWQCCPRYPILSGSGKVWTHTQEIAWRIACHGSHRKFDCLTRPCTEARYWWFIWSTSDVVTYGRHRSHRCIVHNTGEELPATLVNQSFKMPAKTAAVSFGTSILSAYWTSCSSTVADLLL